MLSSTEKILSVVVLALTLAVGFSLMQYGSAMDEMAQLRGEQAEHVDMVNKEFKQRVKAVELENIGQGKEIKRGQDMILANEIPEFSSMDVESKSFFELVNIHLNANA